MTMAYPGLIRAIRFMRRIDQYLGPPICFGLAGLAAFSKRIRWQRSRPPVEIKTILVITFWGMGSIVLMPPALRAWRARYPAASVTFLTFEQNESVCRMIKSID